MPRTTPHKVDSFNFRVDPGLKAAFTAAVAMNDRPAGQVLRDFMRQYVRRQRDRTATARQDSARLGERARDPGSDEAEVMRWVDDVSDTGQWTA